MTSFWIFFVIFQQFYAIISLDIQKGPNDLRDYQFVELKNRLKTILIFDRSAEKSAATIVVKAGSLAEPENFLGLAHYLEHILFLGSKKFPNPEDFEGFLERHGGSSNAETEDLRTSFYFNIQPENFEAALERLADFFISPIFNPDFLEKERLAVDSEYRLNVPNEASRSEAILSQIFNPSHPKSRFSYGNVETLPGPNQTLSQLRDAAIQFYERYYTVENMILVVAGPQKINELYAMANRTFGNVNRYPKIVQKS